MIINESHVTWDDINFVTQKRINATTATLLYRIVVLAFGVFLLVFGLIRMFTGGNGTVQAILGIFCLALGVTFTKTQAQQAWKSADHDAVRRYSFRSDELSATIRNADGTSGPETKFTYDQIKKIYDRKGKLYIRLSLDNKGILFLIVDDDGYVLGTKDELKDLIAKARSDLKF